MTAFLNKLAIKINESEGYQNAANFLFDAYISDLIGEKINLEKSDIKKLIFSSQVFYKSDDRKLNNEGAILLSMMLDICADEYPDLVPIANSVFVNAGDFPNIALLSRRHPELKFTYNFYSEAQMDFRLSLNTVEELDFPLTDFQRSLWEDLRSDKDVITSAPTSAGKTHIILNYLLNRVAKSDGSFAAIIVPTRALITEVAGKIYELAKNYNFDDEIEICTVPRDGSFGAKTFFVMTQERLHEVLLRGDLSFDYLFIDEAHNIVENNRGVLLHLTIEKMLEDSFPQIIISMPSSIYQNSYSSIFSDIEFKKEITEHSPVAKIIMEVVPKGKELIISRYNSNNLKKINKTFKGTKLAEIVYRLGSGQSNIIYRNRTDYCENLANDISDLIPVYENSPLLNEAADYVQQFIHKDFSLAENLRKGIAFHYGPLPSSIRIMVENLAKEGVIKFIACTSTLAEGVNLPAKNLFLDDPYQPIPRQPSERIENVSISNITGRAGRMLQHFSGNIFLIKPNSWKFQDYFDDVEIDEQKIPTYFKSLNEDLSRVMIALSGTYNHEERDQYHLYTIANKLIKEFANNNLDKTLNAKELNITSRERRLLQESINSAYNDLVVPPFTLEANPTVGYIQQNKLYNSLYQEEKYEAWTLPHPNAPGLYQTLLNICERLNLQGVYIPTENYSLRYICRITVKWIRGNSLKDIISDQIEWDRAYAVNESKSVPSVNRSVRNVINVINNDIRFRLSNALRCYHTLLDSVLVNKKIDMTNIKIHSYIEIGACEDQMIALINMGLSREAAKEINDHLLENETIASSQELFELHKSGKLVDRIHAVTNKELVELFS
ncbi:MULTISPECIES: DEAD/DEAH box helicase [unclassified Methylophaga]|uniref:DEAD/DEAH box helicase n=1 Tax=unclassified Methylophaga TaxID=2629249 RepID=UPI000C963A3C|nr:MULTISPECIES: DEAD/DEAH box helicase [unclassified Methylophaga]MBN47842.1 RNA helicase [Methylophaga sp.]|tara:strand:- start:56830 stop:59340 length:2511 start_codon:yes stop_codon:yes gene_type:complete